MKQNIHTHLAPQAIGTYSQAIKSGHTVYLSGQIPLDPETMQLIEGDIIQQVQQVFNNLREVCIAANGTLDDIVKLTVYLIDLDHFADVNDVMRDYFQTPYPARAAIGVAALPKGAQIEVDAVMVINT